MYDRANRKINVGRYERLFSMLGGSTALVLGLSRRSLASLPLILGGGYLMYQGISGWSPVYRLAGIERPRRNGRAGVQVQESITINRPRSEVYQFWRDFENLPRFMEHLEAVQVIGSGERDTRSHWVAKAPMKQRVDWEAEMTEDRENELIAWRSLPGSQITNRGRVEFRDAPRGRGTEVYVRLEYSPPGGSAGAAIAKLFGEEPDLQIHQDLIRFKQILETGEITTVAGQSSGRIKQVKQERAQLIRTQSEKTL